MDAKILRSILRRRPFRPLRLRTSGGGLYDVRHPESAAVLGKGLVVVMEPDGAVDWFEAEDVSDVQRVAPRRNGR